MILKGDNKSITSRVKIDNPKLTSELKNVIRELGLPTDFHIELRGYSKSWWGNYYVKHKKIVLYVLNSDGDYLPYKRILFTALHEAIHHKQYSDPNFKRYDGVMHNPEFIELEQKLQKVIIDKYL